MDTNTDDVTGDFDTVASDRGAGGLGMARGVSTETLLQATGLAALAHNDFGGGPRMPMVPGTWHHGQAEGGPESRHDD